MEIKIPFLPDNYYHIYNHANGNDNLFIKNENYGYFLTKYNQYLSPILETYAYCLMPNHFHFLIKIKSENEINQNLNLQGLKDLEGLDMENFITQQFSNFFNAYAKAYNKMFDRKGAVFRTNLKRKKVDDNDYFTTLIRYIHANPVHHGFIQNLEDWQHSSYSACISDKETKLQRQEVLNWFGDKNTFIDFHRQPLSPESKLNLEFQ